jgi:hypothetical protein
MFTCDNCQTQFPEPGNFCTACGAPMFTECAQEVIPPGPGFTASTPGVSNPDQATARGFGYIFGLHPAVAFFTIAVNLMLFGKDGLALVLLGPTGGGDIPIALLISVAVGAVVGYVGYLGQMKWFGDDHESAKIKGLITGILTAIPTGMPGMLFGSAALAGLLLRKKDRGGLQ